MNDLPKNFCIMPFTHMNIKLTEGKICACWRHTSSLGDYREESLLDVWNGEEYTNMRKSFLNNNFYKGCSSCIELEKRGLSSTRTNCNKNFISKFGKLEDFVNENTNKDFTMKKTPNFIEIRFGNLCNLRCLHCSSSFSSKWNTAVKNNKWLQDVNDHFSKSSSSQIPLKTILDAKHISKNTEHIIITGGEPLINPNHTPFLNNIIQFAPNIHLEYNTNFNVDQKILKECTNLWKYFKKVTLRISLDGSKRIYNFFRTFGDYNLVLDNVDYIKNNYKLPNIDLCMTVTACLYNITDLYDCYFEIKNVFNARFHTSLVQYPQAISIEKLPFDLKKKVTDDFNKINFIDKKEKQFYENVINFMNNDTINNFFAEDTLAYFSATDKLNKSDFKKIYPEFIPYIGTNDV